MKEYMIFKISKEGEDTEEELNRLAKLGWTLVCSYSKNNYWLIMERKLKPKR